MGAGQAVGMALVLSSLRAPSFRIRPVAAGLGAAGVGAALLSFLPGLEIEVFARGAAWGAGFFLGTSPERIAEGWLLARPGESVAVTAACSATDFFLMAAALLAWRFAHRGGRPAAAVAGGLSTAVPVAVVVNALRIVAVTTAHQWFIPRFPAHYSALLHMAVGAAVFLPALIALHVGPEFHGRFRHLLSRSLRR